MPREALSRWIVYMLESVRVWTVWTVWTSRPHVPQSSGGK
jgi:hypothetical protein